MPEQPSPEIDPSIAEFYHQAPEEHRLEQGPFVLEELRSRELIQRHARQPPATVLDVGGAAGAYALWLAVVERDLREGQHRNPTERLDYFTTAYFHRPDELRAEVMAAGLNLEGLYGLEGPGWFLSDVTARLADPRRRTDLLQVARLFESEPSVLGVSAHLLVVARTPV